MPPQRAPGSSGWLGAPWGETGPLGAQPLPRVFELAASKVAHFPAVDHSGAALHRLRQRRLPLARQPRRAAHGHAAALRAHGRARRLHGLDHVQVPQGRAVEDPHAAHRLPLPGHRLHRCAPP
eukprot:scaffold17660_cov46-Phaeocystis_antarctica.AAC.4